MGLADGMAWEQENQYLVQACEQENQYLVHKEEPKLTDPEEVIKASEKYTVLSLSEDEIGEEQSLVLSGEIGNGVLITKNRLAILHEDSDEEVISVEITDVQILINDLQMALKLHKVMFGGE